MTCTCARRRFYPLDTPTAQEEAVDILTGHGVHTLIDGPVLWIYGTDGSRVRCNPGDYLAHDEVRAVFERWTEAQVAAHQQRHKGDA